MVKSELGRPANKKAEYCSLNEIIFDDLFVDYNRSERSKQVKIPIRRIKRQLVELRPVKLQEWKITRKDSIPELRRPRCRRRATS